MNGRIFICDFARVTDNGSRFDAIGVGINLIQTHRFPFPLNFAALIEINCAMSEAEREQSFEVRIIDPDGRHTAPPLTGNAKFSKDHKGALYAAFNLQMLIKKPVSLTLALFMNNEEKDSITIKIEQQKVIGTTIKT